MILIIDYGMGNLRSVQKALERLGYDAVIASSPAEAPRHPDKLILPGVGAFADGMAQLRERQWDKYIIRFINSGRLFMGICLGMQLLFEGSQEDAPSPSQPVAGLGLLPGQVLRFEEDQGPHKPRLKVPHMGWNALQFTERGSVTLFHDLEQGSHVYFVHSYYCVPTDAGIIAATCDYGTTFCAAVMQRNILATQFHPEKSQNVGLKILANFASA